MSTQEDHIPNEQQISSAKKRDKVRKREQRKRRKNLIRNFIIALWVFFIFSSVSSFLFFYLVKNNTNGWFGGMPSLDELDNPKEELSSVIFSSDGEVLGKYYVASSNRVGIKYNELPKSIIETTLAAEDIRFFSHSGIDLSSVIRAVIGRMIGKSYGGGSTLTQQLAKNLFRTREEEYKGVIRNRTLLTLIAKAKEWILSIYIEKKYTKEEILAMYLNIVTFGNNSSGIKVASKTYFNTEVTDISYGQAAVLIGLVNAPSRYNPVKHPTRALSKRNRIIRQLYKYKYIDITKYNELVASPLGLQFKTNHQSTGPAPYFRAVARNFLRKWTKEHNYNLYQDGLKIYTTIDSRVQLHAENAVQNHMYNLQKYFYRLLNGQDPWIDKNGKVVEDYLETEFRKTEHYRIFKKRYGINSDSIEIMSNKKYKLKIFTIDKEVDTLMSPMDSLNHYQRFLNTGFMAIEPKTGHIKAWVGGINHKYFKFDHVYQGKRQPGSTFKAFTYATAVEAGYSPCFEVENIPVTFTMKGQDPPIYRPKNSDKKYEGVKMTLKEALARSINQITAYIIKQVGPKSVVDKAHLMGIKSPLDPVPAICLGVSPVSVYEMVGAYAVFPNKGIRNDPQWITRIEDKDGNIIYSPTITNTQAMSEENAYIMLKMLQGTTQISGGTAFGLGPNLIYNNDIGGKTGTTQNGSDGWFMGVTQNLVAGAWVGGDTPFVRFKNWTQGQGARTALPIVRMFFDSVYADKSLKYEKERFEIPSKPLHIELDCNRYRTVEKDDSLNVTPAQRRRFDGDF